LSIDIADWNGVPLRRRLRSADRFNDAAIALGSLLKTRRSRSRASLRRDTSADQYRRPERRADFFGVRRGGPGDARM
jgi:hypothetical protein